MRMRKRRRAGAELDNRSIAPPYASRSRRAASRKNGRIETSKRPPPAWLAKPLNRSGRHRGHRRAVAATRLAGNAPQAIRVIASVDERDDLLAEVGVVAAAPGRVDELRAADGGERVDEDDSGVDVLPSASRQGRGRRGAGRRAPARHGVSAPSGRPPPRRPARHRRHASRRRRRDAGRHDVPRLARAHGPQDRLDARRPERDRCAAHADQADRRDRRGRPRRRGAVPALPAAACRPSPRPTSMPPPSSRSASRCCSSTTRPAGA